MTAEERLGKYGKCQRSGEGSVVNSSVLSHREQQGEVPWSSTRGKRGRGQGACPQPCGRGLFTPQYGVGYPLSGRAVSQSVSGHTAQHTQPVTLSTHSWDRLSHTLQAHI